MVERIVKVSDFTKFPGGRWKKDGSYSGEEFRERFLKPELLAARAAKDTVVVSLDGVAGYGSSFLEEVFGGIVRSEIMPPDILTSMLTIRVTDSALEGFKADALRYLSRAVTAAKAA
jgi:hypothetical protein